jgi:hypothetical protein
VDAATDGVGEQLPDVSIDQIESLLRRSMEFLTNCYQTYILASPHVRRQLNQAVFEAFFVSRDGSLVAKPTEAFRTLLRTDVLRPRGEASKHTQPSEMHDSREWVNGRPRWMVEAETKQGQSSESRPTPVFSGLGLNEDYLAESLGRLSNPPTPLLTVLELCRLPH